jgi:hypothetical protein
MDTLKCLNFELCGETLPEWWLECKPKLICTNCDIEFGSWKSDIMFGSWNCDKIVKKGRGILNFYDDIDCPICLETSRGVSFPCCDHCVCISCFKRIFYPCYDNEPLFPLPELEDEYNNDPDNPIWDNIPLIKKWRLEWNKWDDNINSKYEYEEFLRKCPICRKN